MFIERDGKRIHLTAEEVYEAYKEQQVVLLLEDAANALKDYICYENMEDDSLEQKEFYQQYGFDYDAAFDRESHFYLLPKLVSMYREHQNADVAESDIWQEACQTLMSDIAEMKKKADAVFDAAFAEIFVSLEEL